MPLALMPTPTGGLARGVVACAVVAICWYLPIPAAHRMVLAMRWAYIFHNRYAGVFAGMRLLVVGGALPVSGPAPVLGCG